jgi:hypothetical protein
MRLETYVPKPKTAEGVPPARTPVSDLPTPEDIAWHYYGVTGTGMNVRQNLATGRIMPIFSPRQKADAIEYAKRFGVAHAARWFNIPRKTVAHWLGAGSDD